LHRLKKRRRAAFFFAIFLSDFIGFFIGFLKTT